MWNKPLFHAFILFFSLASFTALSFGKKMTDEERPAGQKPKPTLVTLFLMGDVMTGEVLTMYFTQLFSHPYENTVTTL